MNTSWAILPQTWPSWSGAIGWSFRGEPCNSNHRFPMMLVFVGTQVPTGLICYTYIIYIYIQLYTVALVSHMCCFWSISILVIFTSGFKTFLVFNPWSLMPNHRRKGASWCVDSQFLGCATRVQCGFLHVWSWYFRRLLRFKHFPNRHPMTNAYLKKALNLGSMKSFSEGDVIPFFLDNKA